MSETRTWLMFEPRTPRLANRSPAGLYPAGLHNEQPVAMVLERNSAARCRIISAPIKAGSLDLPQTLEKSPDRNLQCANPPDLAASPGFRLAVSIFRGPDNWLTPIVSDLTAGTEYESRLAAGTVAANRRLKMRNILTFTSIAVLIGTIGIGTIGPALAQTERPQARQAISIETMKQKIDALGYDVRRVKVHRGVFKARIVERQSGGVVEAIFDRTDGELVRARLGS